MRIFVSGAPGRVGTELVKLLSARGEEVVALIHRPHHRRTLQLPGVETVVGDLAEPGTYREALTGADAVFVNSSRLAIAAQADLVDTAVRVNAGPLVKLSWIGFSGDHGESPIGLRHVEVERALAQSGLPYTILRSNAFMQNYLGQVVSVRGANLFVTSSEAPASIVDARDVAAVAAAVLTAPVTDSQVCDVTGPEALTNLQIAETVSRITRKEMRLVRYSSDELAEGFHRAGLPEWLADELAMAEALRETGKLAEVSDAVPRLVGREATTFAEFVSEAWATSRLRQTSPT